MNTFQSLDAKVAAMLNNIFKLSNVSGQEPTGEDTMNASLNLSTHKLLVLFFMFLGIGSFDASLKSLPHY